MILPANYIEGALISFIFVNSMTRSRSGYSIAYIAALISYPRKCCFLNLRLITHYIMNVRIVFHIMKAVVTGHLLNLQRFRRQRLIVDSFELKVFRWNMIKSKYLF